MNNLFFTKNANAWVHSDSASYVFYKQILMDPGEHGGTGVTSGDPPGGTGGYPARILQAMFSIDKQCFHIYIYIYVYMYTYIYIYVYM